MMNSKELLKITLPMKLTWRYSAGEIMSHFIGILQEEGRILGLKCPSCNKVYLPPRPVCGDCYRELKEWMEVGPAGTLKGFTTCYYKLLDPQRGTLRPIPFGMGLIRLDGADTLINHYLEETDIERLKIDLRVEPVWAEERRGYWSDILYFRAGVGETLTRLI